MLPNGLDIFTCSYPIFILKSLFEINFIRGVLVDTGAVEVGEFWIFIRKYGVDWIKSLKMYQREHLVFGTVVSVILF